MSLILVFHNDGTGATHLDGGAANYEVEVLVGDGTRSGSLTLAIGRVEAHVRADGWEALVRRFLIQQQDRHMNREDTIAKGQVR